VAKPAQRMPAARLWSQASRRPADGLAGSVARTRTPGANAGARNDPPPQLLSSRDGLIHTSAPDLGSKRYEDLCPMAANARAILIEALGYARRWLDELLSDPRHTLEALASQEGKTERSIRMNPAARSLRSGDRQGGNRGTPAALLWPQASRRAADCPAAQVAHARTPDASTGVTNDPLLARLSSGDELIHAIRTASSIEVRTSEGRSKSGAADRSKQQPWKRKFAARDFRRDAPGIAPENRRTAC
jgi:hypothetical protein